MRQFIFILIFQSLLTYGQDTLNKLDSKGRKTGFWKVFQNKNLNIVDSAESYFIALIPFDNGKPVIKNYRPKWRTDSVACDQVIPEKGHPILLNGTFKWFDNKRIFVHAKETYINGYPSHFFYYEPNPFDKARDHDTIMYLFEVLDYTKRYENQPGSHFYYYNPIVNTKVQEFAYKKVKGKWKHEEIREVSSQPLEKEIIGTWVRMNDAKKGKTVKFNANDSASVYFNDPSIPIDNSSYEVLNQNRIILRKFDTYCFLKVSIINGRLRVKSSSGKELYLRKT